MRGISRLGTLIFLLFLAVGVYLGRQVIPFYYYYYEFLGQMEAQARNASVNTDAQIKKFLVQRARELELPMNDPEEDIKINRISGKIIIESQYEEVMYVEFGDWYKQLAVFPFHPRVEKNY